MSEFRRPTDFSRSPLFRQSGLLFHNVGPGKLKCPTAIIEHLDAALRDAPRYAPYVRLLDTEEREAGVYIDSNTLNLLLRLRDLFENPDELRAILDENVEEGEYQEADLESILGSHV
jgi:hypothetical protein